MGLFPDDHQGNGPHIGQTVECKLRRAIHSIRATVHHYNGIVHGNPLQHQRIPDFQGGIRLVGRKGVDEPGLQPFAANGHNAKGAGVRLCLQHTGHDLIHRDIQRHCRINGHGTIVGEYLIIIGLKQAGGHLGFIHHHRFGTALPGNLLKIILKFTAGNHRNAVIGDRFAEGPGQLLQSGTHLVQVILPDIDDHRNVGLDDVVLVDLLIFRPHRHAFAHQCICAILGCLPDDADLLGNADPSGTPLDFGFLAGVPIDHPRRGTGGLTDDLIAGLLENRRDHSGCGRFSANAVDIHPDLQLFQTFFVFALFPNAKRRQNAGSHHHNQQ